MVGCSAAILTVLASAATAQNPLPSCGVPVVAPPINITIAPKEVVLKGGCTQSSCGVWGRVFGCCKHCEKRAPKTSGKSTPMSLVTFAASMNVAPSAVAPVAVSQSFTVDASLEKLRWAQDMELAAARINVQKAAHDAAMKEADAALVRIRTRLEPGKEDNKAPTKDVRSELAKELSILNKTRELTEIHDNLLRQLFEDYQKRQTNNVDANLEKIRGRLDKLETQLREKSPVTNPKTAGS